MATTRREWILQTAGTALLAGLPGCLDWRRHVGSAELRLLAQDPLEIVKWRLDHPDFASVLRRKAVSASLLDPSFLARVDAQMRTVLTRSGGVGLAAPQVGLCRRIILVQLQRPGKPLLTLVDPVIQETRGPGVQGYEACLSVDKVGGKVRRAHAVEVSYRDLRGRGHHLSSTGWEARIVQHEVDHLEGVLYLDRLTGPLLSLEEMRRRRRRERSQRHADLAGGARPGAPKSGPGSWQALIQQDTGEPCLL